MGAGCAQLRQAEGRGGRGVGLTASRSGARPPRPPEPVIGPATSGWTRWHGPPPPLRFTARGRIAEIVLATLFRVRALPIDHAPKNRFAPGKKGRRSAERRMPTIAASHQQTLPLADVSDAAARHADKCTQSAHLPAYGARSPSGAPPRHSPGRTHPPLAQLQFPRFLRPGRAYDPEKACPGLDPGWKPVFRKIIRQPKRLAGVTRFAPVTSLPRSAETGRCAGRAVAQSRPVSGQ